MPDASNATKSRLDEFIQGCSQLQEVYAVQPLEYRDIMGEWWQRINDLIYALGLTYDEETVVNIAWTLPEIGKRRSDFFVEELSTRKTDGTEVAEDARISTVAGDGTGELRAHKYGLVQSIDRLFQRNIDTWGGLYEYFWRQNKEDGAKPLDLTEMFFGSQDISDEDITDIWSRACRTLDGENQGLVNSLKHFIEDIIGSSLYDWLDSLGGTDGESAGGLQRLMFGDSENYSETWERMTTGGLATESVKLIDTLGQDFYDWINNAEKRCTVASSSKVYELWQRNGGTWSRANETDYSYKGKGNTDYAMPIAVYNSKSYVYGGRLTDTTASLATNPSSVISIAAAYGVSGISNVEQMLKREFIQFAINGTPSQTAPLRQIDPTPQAGDAICLAVRITVNKGYEQEYECTKTGLFAYAGGSWSLIESTYGTIVPGVYKAKEYSVPTGDNASIARTCLVERVDTELSDADSGPASLMELLFGDLENDTLCDVWQNVSSGSLLGESQMIKDAIGEDLLDLVNGDPLCVDGDAPKAGPHSLKELLFGSMSTDELCRNLKALSGESLLGEITNITNFLGDAYNEFVINNTYASQSEPTEPVDPTINPMTVMQSMLPGQVLYGSKNDAGKQAYRAEYIVDNAYVCDNFAEAYSTRTALTDQKRMCDTYFRVAYSGTGTPFKPGGIAGKDEDTVYYWNNTVPFADTDSLAAAVAGGAWPSTLVSMGETIGADATLALARPNLQILNCCEDRWYCLIEGTADVEQCQDILNGSRVGTAGMICKRFANSSNLTYASSLLIKTWTSGSTKIYAFASDARTLSNAWTTLHGGVVYKSGNAWRLAQPGTSFASGATVYGSVIFCLTTVSNGIYVDGSNYKCKANQFNSYQYFWNVAMLPRWYNNDAYSNNEYRNHFIYPKRSIFHRSPSVVSLIGMQEQPFSNGAPTDSLSWDYFTDKKLVFCGSNTIKYTGFLSNKKFNEYYFNTSPNSDTDDDDITGVVVGGYKDDATGIVNTLSVYRYYSTESALNFTLNVGGADSLLLLRIDTANDTFKIRHLNGKYGGYSNGGTFVKKLYDTSLNYGIYDPASQINVDSAGNKTITSSSETGYYDTNYGVNFAKFGSASNANAYNRTFTVYRDAYVNTGPSGNGVVSVKLTDAQNNTATYTYTNYTETKNGRRNLANQNQEGRNKWNDVQKVVQSILNIVSRGGLIFGRTHCALDKGAELDVQHVKPFHVAGTTWSNWWGPISAVNRSGILNAVKHVFRKTETGGTLSDAEAQYLLQNYIFPKYQLSTTNFNKLSVDDILKLYHGGTKLFAGDARGACYGSGAVVTALGYVQGYGYLNCYKERNLNDKYYIEKKEDFLKIIYKDIYYNTNGQTTTDGKTDPGLVYLRDHHNYRGDITVTFTYNKSTGVVTMKIEQGSSVQTVTSETNANLRDRRLIKILHEATGYGYISASNPLTNFTENDFVDGTNSTIYDLETNKIWKVNDQHAYVMETTDATTAIYNKFGPGRILSNDITGKVFYTRGDANQVQKIVEGSTSIIQQTQSSMGYEMYDTLKTDILNAVKAELYGSTSDTGESHEDPDETDASVQPETTSGMRSEMQAMIDQHTSQIKQELGYNTFGEFKAAIKEEMGYGLTETFGVFDLRDANGNLINTGDGPVVGTGFFTVTGCTPGKMVVVGHSNPMPSEELPQGGATACGIRVVSGSLMGRGTHPGAFYRLGTNTLQINASSSDPYSNPLYTSNDPYPESYTDYSMSFVIIPNSDTLVFEVIDMNDDGDILYIFK